MELKHYAYMCHFYQTAGPFYDDLIVKIPERSIEFLPLDGIYAFRFFDSVEELNEMKDEKILKTAQNVSGWYYIGNKYIPEDFINERNLTDSFFVEEFLESKFIIDTGIQSMAPLLISDENDIEQILDPGVREKSVNKVGEYELKKWI